MQHEQILESVALFDLGEDGRLRLAGRTPGRVNFNKNRFAGLLRGVEGRRRVGDGFGGKGRQGEQRGRDGGVSNQVAA